MQTADLLKRKIDTTEDLASVVRTMKTLAAVNIRQFETAAASLVEYDRTIQAAVRMLIWHEPDLLKQPSYIAPARTGLIVFGSDQGMCGGFNDAMATYVMEWIHQQRIDDVPVPMIVVGRRLVAHLVDLKQLVDGTIELPGSSIGITSMLQHLLPRIDSWQQEHALDAVMLLHNHRLSQTQYKPRHRRLLPVELRELVAERPRRWEGRSLPLLRMSPRELWQSIARQYLFVALFHACAESQASENAARIAAMQAAETHIRDSLSQFHRDYQQLRQTSITAELLDIVTGFEAITSENA